LRTATEKLPNEKEAHTPKKNGRRNKRDGFITREEKKGEGYIQKYSKF